jgi:hypothetical protein
MFREDAGIVVTTFKTQMLLDIVEQRRHFEKPTVIKYTIVGRQV